MSPFLGVPYYIGDLKGDPSLGNYPYAFRDVVVE